MSEYKDHMELGPEHEPKPVKISPVWRSLAALLTATEEMIYALIGLLVQALPWAAALYFCAPIVKPIGFGHAYAAAILFLLLSAEVRSLRFR